jgi:signal transduction histidine kinase
MDLPSVPPGVILVLRDASPSRLHTVLLTSPSPLSSAPVDPAAVPPVEPSPADLARMTADAAAGAAAMAARLEELGRLQALVISTTAHEMRTPLTVMRAHCDMLAARADELDADTRASLTAIAGAVTRLQETSARLVSELRGTAGGAEDALREWLELEPGSQRTRPA